MAIELTYKDSKGKLANEPSIVIERATSKFWSPASLELMETQTSSGWFQRRTVFVSPIC